MRQSRDTDQLFTKRAFGSGEDLRCEAAALRWLGEAEGAGGTRVARVTEASRTSLTEARVRQAAPTPERARLVGASLARLHAAGAAWFGCPPDGWDLSWDQGYVLANSLTPVVPRDQAPATWGAFFAEWRIRAYARQARDEGEIGPAETRALERVCARLERGDFDAPQPALVEEAMAASGGSVACARLHGDLWAGNVLCDGGPTGATLIDPLAHGGHAETDLAMLQLFGYPYLEEVLAAYDQASPLADGWRERVPLHQLAPLMHHVVLFGGGYVDAAMRVARRFAP